VENLETEMKQMDRRSFLKLASLAGAACVASVAAPTALTELGVGALENAEAATIVRKNKKAWIKEWTKRIDKYLKGSKLEGQGKWFAEYAWKYKVDPRWSPAIACVESGKGKHCRRSHNAWGWGYKSWKTWKSAIKGHINGLSRLYRYKSSSLGWTNCKKAARVYCNTGWYYKVKKQMDKI